MSESTLDAVPGDRPWTGESTVGLLSAAYVVGLFTLQYIMRDRKPFGLKTISIVHNLGLSAFSLWVFLGITAKVLSNWREENYAPELLVCDPQQKLSHGTGFWFHIFYLSKFYEYLDTLFLVLRKKQVVFLHWFHHFVTPSIVWSSWYFPNASNWIGPLTNAFVHVIMYLYYFAADAGIADRKLGKHVTHVQLSQFVLCLVILMAVGFNIGGCNGNIYGHAWLSVQYAIFLGLFAHFHARRTKQLAQKKSAAKAD